MKVEFLLAYDDGTWNTKVLEVSDVSSYDGDARVFDRFIMNWLQCSQYKHAVGMWVYDIPNQEAT